MKENIYIKFYHYKKLITCQPFFIWNQIDKNPLIELNNQNNFWEIPNIEYNERPYYYNLQNINILKDKFIIFLKQKYSDFYECSGNTKNKIENTKNNNKNLVIFPFFEYKNAIAEPVAFDFKTKTIILYKKNGQTKESDLIEILYLYLIISKNIEVKKIKIYFINSVETLDSTEYICLNKNISKNNNTNNKKIKIMDFINKYIFINKNLNKHNLENFSFYKYNFTKTKLQKIWNLINLPDINQAIDQIIKAQKIKTYSLSQINLDKTCFGENSYLNQIIQNKIQNSSKKKFIDFNKRILKNEELIPFLLNKTILLPKIDSIVFKKYCEIKKATVMNPLINEINQIDQATKVIWFDFEGFEPNNQNFNFQLNLQQMVFQVSIIKTIKNSQNSILEIQESDNLVLDTKNINLNDLFLIFKKLYDKNAQAYVVYNKSYEENKLKDILNIFQKNNFKHYEKALKIFEYIKKKIVDLHNPFKITSKHKLPNILLHDQKCKSSIKNIQKHIEINQINLSNKIISYQNLKIQDGLMAMQKANERHNNEIGDIEWIQIKKNLIKYCENDVKAMIMVYDFIKYVLKIK